MLVLHLRVEERRRITAGGKVVLDDGSGVRCRLAGRSSIEKDATEREIGREESKNRQSRHKIVRPAPRIKKLPSQVPHQSSWANRGLWVSA